MYSYAVEKANNPKAEYLNNEFQISNIKLKEIDLYNTAKYINYNDINSIKNKKKNCVRVYVKQGFKCK
ncbi:hypothetical protein RRG40_04325 [Mycoplasmopsis felis]|uniref:hypothetical protein n=1 Tax=Mycoplasmopsis felis TaxID=33923 RepID=UPI002AF6B03D|nr:hypothetical protein [Mycoplasmopsis felis]WQQ01582.1 hypothetical protein RRG54_03265 [Mycoplasmopsis felis]WQQ02792.1 hypothetical protein RNN91_01775 [Mycoplasmopsis felis]WQQ03860.1 hypothetical protein RRG47_03475 [Mycoplasmopsis felis]WQQ05265.1 hypothetical protein RRG59_02815 [Mycoplasmopsis felis]WQQ06966.1 hypothetical protein RRG37_03895 [Mycoplasmopsis felis]